MAKRKRVVKTPKHHLSKSPYFMQPGKRGQVIVLHRACGNRVVPKVCGNMPTRAHAKMLIAQLEKAESVVKDLFLEATDDGIEALEAVLSACCEEVMKRGPRVHEGDGGPGGAPRGGGADGGSSSAARGPRGPRGQRGPRGRDQSRRPGSGGRGPRPYDTPLDADRLPRHEPPSREDDRGDTPYNAAAS